MNFTRAARFPRGPRELAPGVCTCEGNQEQNFLLTRFHPWKIFLIENATITSSPSKLLKNGRRKSQECVQE